MTWSIVTREPSTGRLAIAVSTKNFAVGTRVPFIAAGIGAIASQALSNPFYGVNGLPLLRDGKAPADVLRELTAADPGQDQRQVHMIDAKGRIAAHTGTRCVDWCGHTSGDNFSVAGNMLAGPQVIEETAKSFVANATLPLARRLIAAMQAGEAAGGDKRGRQSCALMIYGEEAWPDLDLRVDDHADPLAELERLEAVSRERWVHFARFLPTRSNPAGELDRAKIDAGIAAALAAEAK
jgi:uncharacterized Ntn-hydrolase superfamily protein